ncbi:hypothetical protein KO516_13540, partial [Citreicella sp. C3M06]|uniref:hypothetical protein n=1 Tax=Citreicella sp. C3M06 TaxID=2841564 RepID=UPI001C089F0C
MSRLSFQQTGDEEFSLPENCTRMEGSDDGLKTVMMDGTAFALFTGDIVRGAPQSRRSQPLADAERSSFHLQALRSSIQLDLGSGFI